MGPPRARPGAGAGDARLPGPAGLCYDHPVADTGRAEADLVVLSDLHMGRGFNPATKRWYRLEAFLHDEDFLAFCRWLCRTQRDLPQPLALVLNGDVFDFLRIEPEPSPGARGAERPKRHGWR